MIDTWGGWQELIEVVEEIKASLSASARATTDMATKLKESTDVAHQRQATLLELRDFINAENRNRRMLNKRMQEAAKGLAREIENEVLPEPEDLTIEQRMGYRSLLDIATGISTSATELRDVLNGNLEPLENMAVGNYRFDLTQACRNAQVELRKIQSNLDRVLIVTNWVMTVSGARA